jgi:hypothetical protein
VRGLCVLWGLRDVLDIGMRSFRFYVEFLWVLSVLRLLG